MRIRADFMKFGFRSVWDERGYIVFIESKKSICLVCLAFVTAVAGVGFVISQSDLSFGITSISFIVMVLLFLRWQQPELSGLYRQTPGKSAYKLTKSFNDMALKQLEKFKLEIERTQEKISIAIREAMRNIHTFAESSDNKREKLSKLIEKTIYFNNELFRCREVGSIRNDLDTLCNHIIIVGQRGLLIINQIQSSEQCVTELVNAFKEDPGVYPPGHPEASINHCVNELRKILAGQQLTNHHSINYEIDTLRKDTIKIKNHASAMKHAVSLPFDHLAGLVSLSTDMTSVAASLMQLSQMLENNLTILLNMCELSVLFQIKSQAFMAKSETIKSKLYRVLTKIRQHKNADVLNEEAALLELEKINDLVNELVFDSPE